MKKSLLLVALFSSLIVQKSPGEGLKNPKPGAAKSQFNSQIYEKESDEHSFTAPVKVVREVQGDTEVFFEGQSGFFIAKSSIQSLLVNSQKKHIPLSVTVNKLSRQILKLEVSTEDSGGSISPGH